MLVKREDPGNGASASALVSNPASTPSSATSVVGRSASTSPYAGLEGVVEHVVDCSVDKKGAICGVRGVVWSLGPTTPSPLVLNLTISCKYKPLCYKFNII